MNDREEFGSCPHCGGESDGSVMYSAPAQTRCTDCKQTWHYGPAIKVLSEEEGRRKRPEMYGIDEDSTRK